MNNPQQQQLESGVFIPEGSEINSKYQSMLDYETYPSRYQNLNINPTNGAGVSQLRVASQCSFRSDKNSCTIIGSQAQIASAAEPDILELEKHSMLPTVRYLQPSQYDEMSEYGNIATSSCNLEPNYVENTAVTYGYVSEANYGVLSETINTNSFSTRALHFDNNLNGAKSVAGMEQKCQPFDSHSEYQSKMSQLTLNPVDVLREIKDDFMDENSADLCSAMRWRDPNLSEVISFLNNPNNAIKSNAAAYLQHLCYMDDPNKQRTRLLGGIPPLIHLLAYDVSDIQKNACGALRNLSYGRQNDENKRAIKNAGGVSALVNLLCRTQESEVKELVTGILWNMSSCEDIKKSIIDDSLMAIVINVIIPHSGWDPVCPGETCFSTVFRNASGILRNVSSAGEYARKSLRESQHLVDSLLYVVRKAIEKNNIGNKTVENCVCILRNLSYRCQEVEDPNYDKQYMAPPVKTIASPKGENLGCFGTGRKKDKSAHGEFVDQQKSSQASTKTATPSSNSVKGYEQLWHPEVIQCYLSLLQSCSNPETLEASAGAIQNLSACYWQPSIDIRATVRKEKGLPILVELLRMEVDRVVCAVATALRNLAIDQRNKELIGKYAMRDLVQKLPSGNAQHDQTTSDDTISAVLATINEVVKKNPEFARSVLDAGGIERLMNITRQKTKYTTCVLKFASQVLYTMWQHNELRDAYKKNGWKEHDFVTKYVLAQNASVNSPNNPNSTLNRPMASQSRTKYEDRTIQRTSKNTPISNGSLGLPSFKESSTCQKDTEEPGRNGLVDDSFERKKHIATVSMFIASDGTD